MGSNSQQTIVSVGVVWAIAAIFSFASSGIVATVAIQHGIFATTLIGMRTLLAYIFAEILSCRTPRPKIPIRARFWISMLGVCFFCGNTFLYLSLANVTPIIAICLFYTFPAIGYVLNVIVFKEAFQKRVLLAMLTMLVGVAMLFWGGEIALDTFGVICGLLAGFSIGWFYALYRFVPKELPKLVLVAWMLRPVAAVTLLYIIFFQLDQVVILAYWKWYVSIALFNTVFALWANSQAIARLGVTRTIGLFALEPLFAVIMALILFSVPFTLYQAIGATIIILVVSYIAWCQRRPVSFSN